MFSIIPLFLLLPMSIRNQRVFIENNMRGNLWNWLQGLNGTCWAFLRWLFIFFSRVNDMKRYIFLLLLLTPALSHAFPERYYFMYNGTLNANDGFQNYQFYEVQDEADLLQKKITFCSGLDGLSYTYNNKTYRYSVVAYPSEQFATKCDYEKIEEPYTSGQLIYGSVNASPSACPVGELTSPLIIQSVLLDSNDNIVSESAVKASGCYNSCSVDNPDYASASCYVSDVTAPADENGSYQGHCSAPLTYTGTTCPGSWQAPDFPTINPPPEDPPPEDLPPETPPGDSYSPTGGEGTGGSGSDSGGAGGGSGGTDPIYTPSDSPDTSYYDPDADNTASVPQCGLPVTCSGDDIACESLQIAHALRCSFIADPAAAESLPTIETDPTLNTGTDINGMLETNGGWLSGGSCPAPINVNALGANLEFDFDPLCNLATAFSALIMVIAGIVALKIIAS